MQKKSDHRKWSLRTTIILVVLLTVATSLSIAALLVLHNVVQTQQRNIKQNIRSTATIVATSSIVKDNLTTKQPSARGDIQRYTRRIQQATHVDFIVVMNRRLIRYSHPDTRVIGHRFSSPKDATKSLTGQTHFSRETGVLGNGYRIFTPVYDAKHQQIGIVCVGLTEKSINSETRSAELPIVIGSLLGLIIGIIAAWLLGTHIRRRLLGMEPQEIATRVTELSVINDSMSEGLIAIDQQRRLITANDVANELVPTLTIGDPVDDELFEALFEQSFKGSKSTINESVLVQSKELIVSTSPLISAGKRLGSMALLRDRSEYQLLADQLAGTTQYIQALRAQTHEFLNKLQAVSGLIELHQYDEVQRFITNTSADYQAQFGNLNNHIQSPAVAGFLMGKLNQSHEQQVAFTITPDSLLPKQVASDALSVDLIKVLGNLIDNAIDAVNNADNVRSEITLSINYDDESNILVIEVTDNGCGISKEVKAHMFEQHYSTKGRDRGYGLVLVKQVVDARNGYLSVTNNRPQGTTFYVELPLSNQKSEGDD